MAKLSVVSIGKLGEYDELLKSWVGDEIDGAIEALDTSSDVSIASKSGNAVTIAGSIAEADGIVGAGSASSITLADVAATGAAGDVAYDNSTSGLTATDVQAALDEVAQASAGGVESKTVYLQDESAGQTDYAKVYKLYQGADASDMTQDVLVGTINIPKDKVVQDGHLVTVEDGVDSDGDTVPAGTADGTYVKLTLQNVAQPIYINVSDLIDAYTGGTTAEATVAISNTNEITVTINTIDGSKIVYKAETSAGAGDGETVKAALTRLDGAASTTGSVAQKIASAIADLDTQSDVTIASKSGDIVTLKAGIKEEDGVIAQGTGSDIALAAVASTGAAADVSYGVSSNVATAISDLETLVGDGVEECTTADIEALFE